jgi:hypothetical protein
VKQIITTIDFKVYNLVYYRKEDGVKFYTRKASGSDYVLINSNTFEKIFRTQGFMRKEFSIDKAEMLKLIKSRYSA